MQAFRLYMDCEESLRRFLAMAKMAEDMGLTTADIGLTGDKIDAAQAAEKLREFLRNLLLPAAENATEEMCALWLQPEQEMETIGKAMMDGVAAGLRFRNDLRRKGFHAIIRRQKARNRRLQGRHRSRRRGGKYAEST